MNDEYKCLIDSIKSISLELEENHNEVTKKLKQLKIDIYELDEIQQAILKYQYVINKNQKRISGQEESINRIQEKINKQKEKLNIITQIYREERELLGLEIQKILTK